jgi:metal-responsive CopG/Arc/MetJ family transcriptional regulator
MAGRQTHVVAVSLPKELYRELETLRARLFRKRSEIVKEAVRQYVALHRAADANRADRGALREETVPYDDEPLTAADEAAIRRGEAEYRRGEYLTLEELRTVLRKRKKRDVARRRR